MGTFLVFQWLRCYAPNSGSLGSIPGPGTRSHIRQLKHPSWNQINNNKLKKKSMWKLNNDLYDCGICMIYLVMCLSPFAWKSFGFCKKKNKHRLKIYFQKFKNIQKCKNSEINSEIYFSLFLILAVRIKVVAWPCSGECLLPDSQPVPFTCILTFWKGLLSSVGISFMRTLILFMRVPKASIF